MIARKQLQLFLVLFTLSAALLGVNYFPYGAALTPLIAAYRGTVWHLAGEIRYSLRTTFPDLPLQKDTVSQDDYLKVVEELVAYRNALKSTELLSVVRNETAGYPLKILTTGLNGDIVARLQNTPPAETPHIDYAVDQNGALAGLVSEQTSGTLKIRPVTSNGLEFSLAGADGTYLGLSHYQEIGFLRIDFLTKDKNVAVGDSVLTAGRDGFFPKDIAVGRIIEVIDTGFYRSIVVRPFFSISETEFLVGRKLEGTKTP